ncbi:hypothetical protein MAPG_05063 [Magnaporthiopsis poae ATCC 64411]|uniref:Uncharacterized protein n=1 Tax=Magnaporthiopsis poae (strain ATCC 64411 / 73-15) TaxID=644358 RepID=A0A0C4DYE2_MAGP6|nr:hypothetical protein MAPG_05063 [Magnaporthiopsis poae ATCC 64411]
MDTPEATVAALAAVDVAIPSILASAGLPKQERNAIVAALEEPVYDCIMGVLQPHTSLPNPGYGWSLLTPMPSIQDPDGVSGLVALFISG